MAVTISRPSRLNAAALTGPVNSRKTARLRPVLASLVKAERVERHAGVPLLATVYHLVERAAAAAYLDAVEGARGRLGDVQAHASGPWAPYAFAPEEPL